MFFAFPQRIAVLSHRRYNKRNLATIIGLRSIFNLLIFKHFYLKLKIEN